MNSGLHVTCGPYHLLFDIARILEVGDAAAGGSAGRRAWRDRQLPVVDLRRRLGLPAAARQSQLVLADDDGSALALVDIDAIVGIRALDEADHAALPPLGEALERLVDGAWLDRASGTCLLGIRLPLDAGGDDNHDGE